MIHEEKVYFDNGNGVKLCGTLLLPSEHAPIVVLCHGFTTHKDNGKNMALAPALAMHGIASLRFDFYGHGESGGDFADITLTEGIDDVKAAVKYLEGRFPNPRIALYGSSYGGAACYYPLNDLHVDGAFLVAPALDYYRIKKRSMTKTQLDNWKKKGYTDYVDYDKKKHKLNYSFLKDLKGYEPAKLAPSIKVPVAIIHGDKDKSVPRSGSVAIAKLIPHGELRTYRGADHLFRNHSERETLCEDAAHFFVDIFAMDPDHTHGKVL